MRQLQPERWQQPVAPVNGTNFHAFVLQQVDGTRMSLRRFQGRWMIVHVGCGVERSARVEPGSGTDAALVHVATEEARPGNGSRNGRAPLRDPLGLFAQAFPSVPWPSTFVVNPTGGLVAIVSDCDYVHLTELFVGVGGRVRATGAVDGGDVVT